MSSITRFFVAATALQGDEVVLDRDDSKHLLKVMRAQPGDQFVAVHNAVAVTCELLPGGNEARGRVVSRESVTTEPPLSITLYQGLAKGEKMDWVIQKGTEIGVTRFVPVACARSVVKLESGRADNKVERWQRIAKEAAEQSRRGIVPTVTEPMSWKEALKDVAGTDLVLVPWESQGGPGGLQRLLAAQPRSVAVFIGPEGGLTEQEVAAAQALGAHPVGLGPRILRTETASIAVLSAILFACGDW